MAKYGIQKAVGPYKHITGRSYDMYYSPNLTVVCEKPLPKGKWILRKSTRKASYKLDSFTTRKQCTLALKKELGI